MILEGHNGWSHARRAEVAARLAAAIQVCTSLRQARDLAYVLREVLTLSGQLLDELAKEYPVLLGAKPPLKSGWTKENVDKLYAKNKK